MVQHSQTHDDTMPLAALAGIIATVWPMVITAESGSGTVRIDLSDIQVDAAPATAFMHPARAERLQ